MAQVSPSDLRGLVDMGSNGIRFSITDVNSLGARSLPVVYQDRLGISLYDAQYATPGGPKGPIPQKIIDEVVIGLKRFKLVCADFGVSPDHIKILATEATRTAVNSVEYRQHIKDATGWEVEMLSKEDEGKVGALGIASSFDTVSGLVMDLGGGSTQLAWMIYENGEVTTSAKGAVSFPYGAAAMTSLLKNIDEGKHSNKAREEFKNKIKAQYTEALETIELPDILKERARSHGLTLYLSGGGFRGWGYILMSRAKKGPYPIPIINGYHVAVKDFSDTGDVKTAVEEDDDIFRVSKRRAAQVPAVAFLVGAIMEAFPFITDVRFCQGGVREGYLFSQLPTSIKALAPLPAATARFAIDSAGSEHIATLLGAALPSNGSTVDRWHPPSLSRDFLRALADTMYNQRNAPKESAALSALYLPITGVLTSAHGISHTDRALLALALSERWDGDLPPPHDDFALRLQNLLTVQEVWWARYIGTVAALIGDVFPAGTVPESARNRVGIQSSWAEGLGKKGNQQGVVVTVKLQKDGILGEAAAKDLVEAIEDMGKKKNRVGGKEYGFGITVRADVEWVGEVRVGGGGGGQGRETDPFRGGREGDPLGGNPLAGLNQT